MHRHSKKWDQAPLPTNNFIGGLAQYPLIPNNLHTFSCNFYLMLCRSNFDAGFSFRRRSGPGGPCRYGMDTASSQIVESGAFSSKINKKRTWSFPVFISRRSKRKCINKIRKHVHACICSIVLLLSNFNNTQMILLCSNFFCSCCLKQFKLPGYQQLRIFTLNSWKYQERGMAQKIASVWRRPIKITTRGTRDYFDSSSFQWPYPSKTRPILARILFVVLFDIL